MELDRTHSKDRIQRMTALCHKDGHLRGEEGEAGQKQCGGGWWRLIETVQAGALEMRHAVQPQTDKNGKTMVKPYVPHGMERIKVKETDNRVILTTGT